MQSITPAELAQLVHSDDKRVRKFLRDITPRESQPGRGRRWALPGGKRNLQKLQKQYDTWREAHTRAS